MPQKMNEKFWNIFPSLFGVSIFCTALFFSALSYNFVEKQNRLHFLSLIDDTKKTIYKRYSRYEQALFGGLGFFKASNFVERNEWQRYVEALNIQGTLQGINGIGYIEYVPDYELPYFLVNTQNDNAESFINHPETQFKDKFIIKYITPVEGNEEALGLDIGFERNRRMTAEYARDTGQPALTKKIDLVQDDNKRAGFLLLIPHYKNGSTPLEIVDRRKNIKGWVYAPFIGENFFKDLNILSDNQISYTVYDSNQINGDTIIYSNTTQNSLPNGIQTQITLANKTWLINWHKNKKFLNPSNHLATHTILIIGTILSILSMMLFRVILKQRDTVKRLVDKRTFSLRKSEEFSRLIMNNIPDLIFVKDEDFKIVKANKAFMDIFSHEQRDKIIGHTTIENFSKEEADLFLKNDRIAFENGISQVFEKIKIYDGREINIFTTKVRFLDENNQAFILGIARDISDLVNTQKNLESKVEERTKEYKEQKLIAEKAAKIKEEFLANMSHELRTPLNSIIGLTNILADEGQFNEEHDEFIKTIQKASSSLLRTVNDILDIAKLEAGKIELENEVFSLNKTLHDIIDQIKPIASQKGLEIRDNISDLGQHYIRGDEHRISRIITNLTSNAVKYTEKGHVDVQVSLDNESDQIHFTCEVSDTGIGISEKNLDGIFDKFKQAEKFTERKYGGSGLGLSITKQLLDLMKGKIFVKSTPNKGSKFAVKIPMKKSTEEEFLKESLQVQKKQIYTQQQGKPFSECRVLIAEDHSFNQILISKLIRRLSCNDITIADNGSKALTLFKKAKFDLILMDCHMPEMSGYEAASLIRNFEENNNLKRTPVFAMTADVMAGTREKCISAGMDEYIAKPIEEDYLKTLLEQHFSFNEQKITTHKESKSDGFIDLSLLREYADNDFETQKELVSAFYKKSKEDLEKLRQNSVDGHSIAWIEAAHTMKGGSSYVGAKQLTELCDKAQIMEDTSKKEKSLLLNQINHEYQKVINLLKTEGLLE